MWPQLVTFPFEPKHVSHTTRKLFQGNKSLSSEFLTRTLFSKKLLLAVRKCIGWGSKHIIIGWVSLVPSQKVDSIFLPTRFSYANSCRTQFSFPFSADTLTSCSQHCPIGSNYESPRRQEAASASGSPIGRPHWVPIGAAGAADLR